MNYNLLLCGNSGLKIYNSIISLKFFLLYYIEILRVNSKNYLKYIFL